eukprot:gene1088-10607_t
MHSMNSTVIETILEVLGYFKGNENKEFAKKMLKMEYGLVALAIIVIVQCRSFLWTKISEFFRKSQQSTSNKIKSVLLINHYAQEFPDEAIKEDLEMKSFEVDGIQIQKVFDSEENKINANIKRRGREFDFRKEYWDRYAICGESLKKSSPDIIVSLCPSTMMFYIGYAFNVREQEHFIITSYFTPKKQFTHIQTDFIEYKKQGFPKLFWQMEKHDDLKDSDDMIVFITTSKDYNLKGAEIEGFSGSNVSIKSKTDFFITSDNFKDIMCEVSSILFDLLENNIGRKNWKKIGLLFACPACIPYSIGNMVKGKLFKYQKFFYLVEPSDHTLKYYHTKALNDFYK